LACVGGHSLWNLDDANGNWGPTVSVGLLETLRTCHAAIRACVACDELRFATTGAGELWEERRRSRQDVLVLKTIESRILCGFEVDARLSPLRCRYDITPKVVVSEEADSHERFAASSSLARMSLA
jgi:hypothetical protein